jgi:hypothetical protein
MDMTPKPGDFPIGSVESRAAMRALLEGQKGALIPVRILQFTLVEYEDGRGGEYRKENLPPALYSECDPKLIGSDFGTEGNPGCWMTRQELEAKQLESKQLEVKWRERRRNNRGHT